uniref:Neuropilin and tolloid-like protein 2 n=1 Tax=Cacopsylla melanoneura TaxID=428564 RepID=A0A8D8QDU5_9HEMI
MWSASKWAAFLFVLFSCSVLCDTLKTRSATNSTVEKAKEEINMRNCAKFEIGDEEKKEFYSPLYPNTYSKNTKCTRTIEAPKGELIRIDFRDSFKLEPSENCKYDYLEIRDGPQGYSKLLGRFCGSSFPPMLTSSSRHLYLRFFSDDNVEYSGFRAVYSFVPRPASDPEPEDLECKFYISDQEGYVNHSNIPQTMFQELMKNNQPIDCMWVINVTKGWKIQLVWSTFKLQFPNDCDSNFIEVFPEEADLLSRIHNFCGSIADNLDSPDNILNIRFVADPKAFGSIFEANYTAYREKTNEKNCSATDEYDCDDNKCIDKSLKCNGKINCRFRWDEDDSVCKKSVDPVAEMLNDKDILLILAIFCLILGGMCVAFLCKIVRKLVHDHKVITQNMKASRESRLNELGAAHVEVLNSTMGPIISSSGPGCSSDSGGSSVNGGHEGVACYVPREEIVTISGKRFSVDVSCDKHSHILRGARNSRTSVGEYSAEDEDGLQRNSRLSREMNPFYEHSGGEEFMKDSSCQTRESLFQSEFSGGEQHNSSESTTPPLTPPLPPSLHQLLPRDLMRHQAPTFSTFAPPPPPPHPAGTTRRKHTMVPVLPPTVPPLGEHPHQFQAEAVIEMNNYPSNSREPSMASRPSNGRGRPYSVQSTKSAPDVIVSH